ncbi:hypothetical protein ABZ192_20420 [Streptomyces sp. NPDC006235]|uniref:hypothetical protein n=1 Tax=Streptomyces sp. NPDC006235 TaxID=3156736 RepID=UPI0033A09566
MSSIRTHEFTLAPGDYSHGGVHSIKVPQPAGRPSTVGRVLAFRVSNPTDVSGASSGEQSAGLAYKVGSTWVEAMTVRPASATDGLAYSTGNPGDAERSGNEASAVYDDATPLYVLFSNTTNVQNTGAVAFHLVVEEV